MTSRFPWPVLAAVAFSGLYFGSKMAPAKEGPLHLRAAGQIPVVDGGRVKPFDTLARSMLQIVSGKQTFKDADGAEQPAVRWLLDVMAGDPESGPAAKDKVFRIENDQVLKMLGLPNRPRDYRYSPEEIGKHFDQLKTEAGRVFGLKKREAKLDLFDQ
jgi:hypothetical protein